MMSGESREEMRGGEPKEMGNGFSVAFVIVVFCIILVFLLFFFL